MRGPPPPSVVVLLQREAPRLLAHAPLRSLTQAPFPAHSELRRGWGAAGGAGMFAYISSGARTGYPAPPDTHTHKQPTHALTEAATNLTPPPAHTDTDIHTDPDTETQPDSNTDAHTQTHPGRGRPRARAARSRPRPPAPHADTPDGVQGGHARHTPRSTETRMLGGRHRLSGAAGDSNPRVQTKPAGSLRPLGRSEPPPRPLPTSPGAAPSLTHRPGRGWPRRAPSSRRGAGAGAGRKGPPSRFPAGSLAGRWRAWVPGGWCWGEG